jgi:hypothetical protein
VRAASALGEPFWASSRKERLQTLNKGDRIAVSVRPEAIFVNGSSPALNPKFRARVQKSAFLGNRIDLRLDLKGQEFRCQVARFDQGAGSAHEVDVEFDSELAWVV